MSIAETNPDRFSIGGNNPPPLAELLAERFTDLGRQVEALAERANGAPKEVRTEADLHAVGELVKAARNLSKTIDNTRVDEKEPHLKAGREVDAFFKVPIERLNRISASLGERADAYQRRIAAEERRRREEAARQAAEQAARQRRIAEEEAARNRPNAAARHEAKADDAAARAAEAAAAAQAPAADLTRTRTASGTVVSSTTSWGFEIENIDKVDLDALRPFIPRADLEKAIRSYVRINKGDRPIAGVRIYQDVKASFR